MSIFSFGDDQATPAGAPPGGGGGSPGALIKDSSDQAFMQDVIDASNEAPVMVDFWAPWCGPCKNLTPVLEKVVQDGAGKVKLVKINIDENPGVAGQLGVRSIPAVFAFDKGRPVDGFMGALPEGQIREFVTKLLSGTDAGKSLVEAVEQADELSRQGDIGGAAQIYAAVINQDPENVPAIAGLARCYLANGDAERARETLNLAPEDKRGDTAWKSVNTAIELMGDAPSADEFADAAKAVEADPGNHDARFDLAEKMAAGGRVQDAADHLLTILSHDLNWADGKAKEKLLTLFEAAGPKDPITVEGRRRLSSLMFA
ncbi:MAG: thioredoxin [Pseudomonadota bacterium]